MQRSPYDLEAAAALTEADPSGEPAAALYDSDTLERRSARFIAAVLPAVPVPPGEPAERSAVHIQSLMQSALSEMAQ